MKKIVLLTDFSANAKNAIKYGVSLFGNSVEYILIHTYTVRKATGSFANIGDLLRQDALKELENELNFVKNEFANISDLNITALCKEGEPVDIINELNTNPKID